MMFYSKADHPSRHFNRIRRAFRIWPYSCSPHYRIEFPKDPRKGTPRNGKLRETKGKPGTGTACNRNHRRHQLVPARTVHQLTALAPICPIAYTANLRYGRDCLLAQKLDNQDYLSQKSVHPTLRQSASLCGRRHCPSVRLTRLVHHYLFDVRE